MTRDEAIKKLGLSVQYPGDFVDGLCALGLLKLDEPERSAEHMLADVKLCFGSELFYIGKSNASAIMVALKAAGFKITKDKP